MPQKKFNGCQLDLKFYLPRGIVYSIFWKVDLSKMSTNDFTYPRENFFFKRGVKFTLFKTLGG